MVQLKFICLFLAIMTIVVLDSHMAEAIDYLAGLFSGPCWAWSGEQCRRLCKDEGARGGHCSPGMQCWCESN